MPHTIRQKARPHEDPFDPARAVFIPDYQGMGIDVWKQGNRLWWEPKGDKSDFSTITDKTAPYSRIPQIAREFTQASWQQPGVYAPIARISKEAMAAFSATPETGVDNVVYLREFSQKHAQNGTQYLGPLCMMEERRANWLPIADAFARVWRKNLPTDLLWTYSWISMRVTSKVFKPGQNVTNFYQGWHTHTPKGKTPQKLRLGNAWALVSDKFPSEFSEELVPADQLTNAERQRFDGYFEKYAWDADENPRPMCARNIHRGKPGTLYLMEEATAHTGGVNTTGHDEKRVVARLIAKIPPAGVRLALKEHPEIRDLLQADARKMFVLKNKI